jgi:hypothetical protein
MKARATGVISNDEGDIGSGSGVSAGGAPGTGNGSTAIAEGADSSVEAVEADAPDGPETARLSPACGPTAMVTFTSSACSTSSSFAPALGVASLGSPTSPVDSEGASTVGADVLSASTSEGVRESSEISTTSGIGGGLGGEAGTEATTAGVSVAGIDGASDVTRVGPSTGGADGLWPAATAGDSPGAELGGSTLRRLTAASFSLPPRRLLGQTA